MHEIRRPTKLAIRLLAAFVFVCLLAAPASAWDKKYFTEQEREAIRQHLRYNLYGFGSFDHLTPHTDYGSRAGATIGFSARVNDYLTPFVETTAYVRTGGELEPEGEGAAASLGITLTPSDYFSSTTAVTFGSNSDFLPAWRVDQEFGIYLPLASEFTLGIHPGAFYARYFTENDIVGVFIGPALYFYRWAVGYTFTVSESYPGELTNYAHIGYVGYTDEGTYTSFLVFTFGDVNYEDQFAATPEQVDEIYWEASWSHKYWIGVNWGLMGSLRYGQLSEAYEQFGGDLGLFYEF
ncbi:MAG: YaiO family outer membrane beta-barrel protein [Candidatus Lernaella stagnicola]|nr:YaiO family outer membrane beta-barrel protein [Candidatus Lernaella stagnicola]